jgi:hypothetical protein
MRLIFLLQIVTTLLMTGIIWFVQIVHYPLFARVGVDSFAQYEALHATRTGWVVGPLMCIEFATALLLLLDRFRPSFVTPVSAWTGAVLLLILWLATGLIQVPLHNRLGAGYDAATIAQLVATNWIRTVAWTLRSALVLAWIAKALQQS